MKGGDPVGARPRQTDRLFDLLAHGLERDPELLESLRRHALTLVNEAEQYVLGADEAVVEQPRFFLREHQHSASPVSKPFEHSDRLPRRFNPDPECTGRSTRSDINAPPWAADERVGIHRHVHEHHHSAW